MIIYGVASLAACYLLGLFGGKLIGFALGIDANVGGVGLAMLLLMYLTTKQNSPLQLSTMSQSGITFWSAMYIPIVIAMAAKQNVLGALSGGGMAILAGTAAVLVSFCMIPVLARFTQQQASASIGSNDDD